MPIKYALTPDFQHYIYVDQAHPTVKYKCPYCKSADISLAHSRCGMPFFRTCSSSHHTQPQCKRMEENKDTCTLKDFDPCALIERLMKPSKGKDRVDVEDPDGTEQHMQTDGEPTELNDEGGIERPFNSLSDIWNQGLTYFCSADTIISGEPAKNHMMLYQWFNLFPDFKGGKYIIQTDPFTISSAEKKFYIIASSSQRNHSNPNSNKVRQVLRLSFSDKNLFLWFKDKLFEKYQDRKSNTLNQSKKYKCILVAGLWNEFYYKGERQFECIIKYKKQIYLCKELL